LRAAEDIDEKVASVEDNRAKRLFVAYKGSGCSRIEWVERARWRVSDMRWWRRYGTVKDPNVWALKRAKKTGEISQIGQILSSAFMARSWDFSVECRVPGESRKHWIGKDTSRVRWNDLYSAWHG
jgi:hypothetical protein